MGRRDPGAARASLCAAASTLAGRVPTTRADRPSSCPGACSASRSASRMKYSSRGRSARHRSRRGFCDSSCRPQGLRRIIINRTAMSPRAGRLPSNAPHVACCWPPPAARACPRSPCRPPARAPPGRARADPRQVRRHRPRKGPRDHPRAPRGLGVSEQRRPYDGSPFRAGVNIGRGAAVAAQARVTSSWAVPDFRPTPPAGWSPTPWRRRRGGRWHCCMELAGPFG